MPRLLLSSFSWPFKKNNKDKQQRPPATTIDPSTIPSAKQHQRRRRAPRVEITASSPYTRVNNHHNTRSSVYLPHHHPTAASSSVALAQSPYTIYNLEENPSIYFPAPPPRVELNWDYRHTAVWDELFDWAENYQTSSVTSTSTTTSTSHEAKRSRLTFRSVLDLTSTGEKKESKSKGLGLKLRSLGLRSEIWSKSSIDMTTPVAAPSVPPRSRLRAQAPPPLNPSTTYLLPVDTPLPDTPALSSTSSSDQGSPPPIPVSPLQETLTFGRRKKSQVGLGKDPLKVRDGTEARRSSSGVYTPTTFPGAEGPRPSHFPSHVYTPASFSLHSTNPPRSTPGNYAYLPAGPSRSASISSADSEGPTTPASSSGSNSRFSTFSGRAMTGLKRISHQISSNVTPPVIKTPLSARDSYFPSSIGADVPRVYGQPQTPGSTVSRPYTTSTGFSTPMDSPAHGLGVGLSETHGTTTGLDSRSRTNTVLFDESVDFTGSKTSPQARGKRKPVPRMLDDQLAKKMEGMRVEETHAL